MMKILLTLLAAQCLPMVGALKDCKQANDYVRAECGEPDKSLVCCTYKQACITVTPHKGDDKASCNAKRKLSGAKAMKIVLIPLIFGIMDIVFIVYMVLKMRKIANAGVPQEILWSRWRAGGYTRLLCVAAIAVSWPLLLTKMWFFGVWAAFLALFVFYMSSSDGMPRWMYRIVWAMQIFQVVLIFGPNEAFHVPLFNQSLATGSSDLLTNILGYTEAACNAHYGGFFEYDPIEKTQTEFNLDATYYGLCTEGWIGFVQTFVMFQALVWMVSTLISAQVFLNDGTRMVNTGEKESAEIDGKAPASGLQKPAAQDDPAPQPLTGLPNAAPEAPKPLVVEQVLSPEEVAEQENAAKQKQNEAEAKPLVET